MKKLLIVLAAIGCLLTACSENKPEAKLVPLKEATINFSDLKGNWVVINYWASWCKPCIKEIPLINQYYQRNKTKNLKVFGVNYDHLEKSELQALITKLKINFPTLAQDPAQALQLGDIPGIPVTYIYNPQGQLVKKLFGGLDEKGGIEKQLSIIKLY